MRLNAKPWVPVTMTVAALLVITNPVQALIDADADGFSQAADCNDDNSQVWATPGEATQLSFAADKTTLSWAAPAGLGGAPSSIRYDTLRSTSPSNFASAPPGLCFDPEGLATSSIESSVPPAGTVFFYLVRAKNDCGDATLGTRSGGVLRAGMVCDCSALCNDGLACTRDRCNDGVCAHDVIAPSIQAQPASVAACPGDSTLFSIRASGQGTLHYQWKKGVTNVGTDNSALTLPVALADNGAQITCAVTDTCSATSSAAATLTVFASAASCSGGSSGLEAPNGASDGPGAGGSAATQICHRTASAQKPYTMVQASVAGCGGSADAYLFSGEFYLEATDLVIEGRGFDFVWSRKYRSREGRLTPMGQGWDFSYNQTVSASTLGRLVVADGNSRRDTYVPAAGGCYTATGFFRELCPQVDGTFVLTFPDKSTWKFAALDGSAAQGRIVRIQDANTNAMTFTYDAGGRLTTITDPLGRPITVSYNPEGFVSAVTDFGGRQVSYGYATSLDSEGSPGDLIRVRSAVVTGTPTGNDFPLGKTTSYTYSKGTLQAALDHNLLTITDPTGAVVLRNVYTPVSNPASPRFDRLDRQISLSGTRAYVYIAQAPESGETAVTKTCYRDDAGNVDEASFDAGNRMVKIRTYTGRAPSLVLPTDDTTNRPTGSLRPTDPSFFETRLTWNPDALLLSATLPEGNSIAHTYDSANFDVRLRANRLQSVRSPGPRGGDQPTITESWAYTTSFGSEFDSSFWTSHTNGLGRTSTRTIDAARGNVLQIAAPLVTIGVLGGGTQSVVESWDYNAFGQMTQHIDPTGQNDTYAYYASGPQTGYLQSVTVDAPGSLPGSHFVLLTVTARDAFGNATARTDPSGHTETSVFNQLDQPVRRTSSPPFNYRTDVYYDMADRQVSVDVQNVDENGVVEANDATSTLYYYDALSRLVKTRMEPDTVKIDTEYQYDANSNKTLERHGEAVNGNQPTGVVRSLYDERDLLFKATVAEGDPQASTTQWDYDKNGNLTATRAGLEATPEVTTYIYDGYDRRISATDPMGNLTTTQYDAESNATFLHMEGELIDGESGPNVRLSEATPVYDELDRQIRSDVAFFDTPTGAPIGDGFATTKTFYDAASRVIRVEDDNAHGTNTTYDTADRVAATVDAAGNSHTRAYDANSNVLTVTDSEVSDLSPVPQTFVTTYAYDNLDRQTSYRDPAGNESLSKYDSRSSLKQQIDARGNVTQYTYDGANRLIATGRTMTDTGTGSGTVSFVLDGTRSHDDNSRLVSKADDNGNTTTYQYDALDRLVLTTNPDGTSESTSYDVHGNPTQWTDPNGSVTTATFDADDRVKTRSVSRAAGVLGTTAEVWKYDGLSRIVHAANDGSVVTRKYDSLSNVTQETLQIGAGPVRTLTASFDGAGNRTSMLYPSGVTVAETRDLLDRAKTITTTGPKVCSGGPTPGIPCAVNANCGSGGLCQPLAAATTSFDYVGPDRVLRRKCCGASPNEQLDLLYDADRRVTRTTHARLSPATLIDDHSYAWDSTDNKTSRTQLFSSATGVVDTYAYDSASRLVHSVNTPSGLPPVPIDYALDGVGNRTTVTGGTEAGAYAMSSAIPEPADRQVNQYTSTPPDGASDYDRNGNLLHKTNSGETFSYDYHDQMVQVVGPGGTHTYGYDAWGRRILADGGQFFSDGSDTVEQRTVTGTPKSMYVYGDHIDEVLMGAQDVDGNNGPDRVAYHADDMGNVMAVTNGSGAVLESYDYEGFGKPRFFNPAGSPIAQSAIGNVLLFNGHRYDSETGLYDYRTRYLDPRAGRFTSRDSIGTWGDEGNLGNGNAYAGNNPWSEIDPMGASIDAFLNIEEPVRKLVVCPCPAYAPAGTICHCWSGMNPDGGGGGGGKALGNSYAMYSMQKGGRRVGGGGGAVFRAKPKKPPPDSHPGYCQNGYCGMAPSGGGRGGSGGGAVGAAKPKPKPKPPPDPHPSRPIPGDWDGQLFGMAPGGGGSGGSGGANAMTKGIVKFFNEAKGFGFATSDPMGGGTKKLSSITRWLFNGGKLWDCVCDPALVDCHKASGWHCWDWSIW